MPRIFFLAVCFVANFGAAADESGNLGNIEGVVTYQPDAKRPWRYSRYYIKQAKTGELAEAVVALRGKGLRSDGPRETTTIDQKNFLFVPETIAVRQGDSVKFTNGDSTTHNVRVSSDLVNFNANMPAGGSHTVILDKAGGISQPLIVGCVFHSAMRANIFIFNHPFYQVTQADGRFKLSGIPPGEYDLEMAHPAGELRWRQKVAVKAGETLRVDIRVSPDDKR